MNAGQEAPVPDSPPGGPVVRARPEVEDMGAAFRPPE